VRHTLTSFNKPVSAKESIEKWVLLAFLISENNNKWCIDSIKETNNSRQIKINKTSNLRWREYFIILFLRKMEGVLVKEPRKEIKERKLCGKCHFLKTSRYW